MLMVSSFLFKILALGLELRGEAKGVPIKEGAKSLLMESLSSGIGHLWVSNAQVPALALMGQILSELCGLCVEPPCRSPLASSWA